MFTASADRDGPKPSETQSALSRRTIETLFVLGTIHRTWRGAKAGRRFRLSCGSAASPERRENRPLTERKSRHPETVARKRRPETPVGTGGTVADVSEGDNNVLVKLRSFEPGNALSQNRDAAYGPSLPSRGAPGLSSTTVARAMLN